MSTQTSLDRCRAFVDRLGQLDSAERARLKRNAGNTLTTARRVADVFWRIRPYDLPSYLDETYFLVATLYPFVQDARDQQNFGRALKRIRTDNNAAGLERRLTALLDADEQQLPFRLRQLVMRFKGDNQALDWGLLLFHLTQWNHPDRWAQLQWARGYYTADKTESTPETANLA